MFLLKHVHSDHKYFKTNTLSRSLTTINGVTYVKTSELFIIRESFVYGVRRRKNHCTNIFTPFHGEETFFA